MELAFVKQEESGWRGRGAPRREVPQEILDHLRRTQSGDVGVIDTRGDSDDEVREVLGYLRTGARRLGHRIRIQEDPDNDRIRFQLGAAL